MISKEQPLSKGILLGTCIPNDREREGSHGKAARKRYPAPSSLQGTERAAGREMAVSRADPTLPHRETLEARRSGIPFARCFSMTSLPFTVIGNARTEQDSFSKGLFLAKGILLGTCIPNDREREGSHGKAARKRYPAPSSLQGTERAAGREMAV